MGNNCDIFIKVKYYKQKFAMTGLICPLHLPYEKLISGRFLIMEAQKQNFCKCSIILWFFYFFTIFV